MKNSLYAKKIREIFPEASDAEDDCARRRVTFTAYRAVRRNGTRITVGQLARLAALFKNSLDDLRLHADGRDLYGETESFIFVEAMNVQFPEV